MYRNKLRALGVTAFIDEETEVSDNIMYFKQADRDRMIYSSMPRSKEGFEVKSSKRSPSAKLTTTVKTIKKPLKRRTK